MTKKEEGDLYMRRLYFPKRRGADRAPAPSSPHKTGEVLGDSCVSGDPVNGIMHGLMDTAFHKPLSIFIL